MNNTIQNRDLELFKSILNSKEICISMTQIPYKKLFLHYTVLLIPIMLTHFDIVPAYLNVTIILLCMLYITFINLRFLNHLKLIDTLSEVMKSDCLEIDKIDLKTHIATQILHTIIALTISVFYIFLIFNLSLFVLLFLSIGLGSLSDYIFRVHVFVMKIKFTKNLLVHK